MSLETQHELIACKSNKKSRGRKPHWKREERVGSQGGEKRHGQVARLEPSLGQEDGKG
jgi:hypothetical protein